MWWMDYSQMDQFIDERTDPEIFGWMEKQVHLVYKRPEAKFKEFKPRHGTTKTGSNWASAQISKHWIQFQVEPTMFEPSLKF